MLIYEENLGKVICEDALKYLKSIESESIDFILTDPPFFINEEVSIIRRSNELKYKGRDINFLKDTEWDRQWNSKSEYFAWFFKILKEFYRILKPYRHLCFFCDKKDISIFGYYGEKLGFKFRTSLFLVKTNPVPQARQVSPMKSVEVILWFTKGKPKRDFYNWQLGMHSDIIYAPIPQKEGNTFRHPTQKPLFAGLFLTSLFSKPFDICLDPFAGSLTFSLSAKLLNRKFISIDINEEYLKKSLKRLIEGLNNKEVNKIYNEFLNFMFSKMNKKYEKEFYEILQIKNKLF